MEAVTTTTTTTTTTREVRAGAAAMLGLAVVWPRLPLHPPIACPLRSTTGIPCPLCGLTRAVVAAAHGNVLESMRFNPAGILVVLLAIALVAGTRLDRVRRFSWSRPHTLRRSSLHGSRPLRPLRVQAWLLVSLAALLWAWNIGFNPTFR